MSTQVPGAVFAPHARHGLSGSVRVPPSKSLTQRALVVAALAGQGSRVVHPLDAEDPRLLLAALSAVGYRLQWRGDEVCSDGFAATSGGELFMGNNGTGARFMLAQLVATPGSWRLDGVPRLRQRPFAPLVEALRSLGASIRPASIGGKGEEAGELPLTIDGSELDGGRVSIDPSFSSQFVSALLLLAARLPRGLVVTMAAAPPSRPYLDLTEEVLNAFGVEVVTEAAGSVLRTSGAGLAPARFEVEGDWSAAAFPLAAVAVAGGEISLEGVRPNSRQGDAIVIDLLERAGCSASFGTTGLTVAGPARKALRADLRHAPDLFPALCVVVARCGGELTGLEGLAAKESDRLVVMTEHLQRLGFQLDAGPGWFRSQGGRQAMTAPGDVFSPAADHRIAMALAVAGTVVPGVRVADPGCVVKSWPDFWEGWRLLVGE